MSDRLSLLEQFRCKARCTHTQWATTHTWNLLRSHLTRAQQGDLLTAWDHAGLYEGPAELDEVCSEIRKGWES